MSEDINFLPEKDKEKKEREQVKKTRPGIKFHTPALEEQTVLDSSDSPSWVVFLKDLFRKLFKKKKKPVVTVPTGKQPVKLENQTEISGVNPKKRKQSAVPEENPVNQAIKKQNPISTASLTSSMPGIGADYSQVDVNLMPWQDPLLKQTKWIRLVIIILSILVVGIWGTMLRVRNSALQEEVDSLKSAIAVVDADIQEIQKELATRDEVDVNHQQAFVDLYASLPRWSKFFVWLEGITHKQVSFTDVTATEGSVTLPVVAPDYDIAVQQWLAFRNATNWTENVVTSGFTGGTQADDTEEVIPEVSYTVMFKLVDGVLLLSKEDL